MEEEISKEMQAYLDALSKNLKEAYKLANSAKKQGYDIDDKASIPLAENLGERIEGLISVAVPTIIRANLPKRIKELEKKYKKLDWRIALTLSLEVAQQKLCKFENNLKAIETGIRVGLAYLTLGIVASPIEGFVELRIQKTRDNKDYFCLRYSGPIRSAGGTAGAVSVLLADYLRKKLGYAAYDPTEAEIRRIATEVIDYHERVTNLQYLPTEEELIFLARNIPVQIDGDGSEKIEVSNYKDLDRIESNRVRDGICLVFGECLAQKAKKLHAQISRWGKEFDMDHWSFLREFLEIQKQAKSKKESIEKGTETNTKISPDYTYIQDLVAGRPILSYPLRPGGFRLRYGRSRVSGYSSACISPLTTIALNNFIAIGTQLRVERPGKATAVSICDSIEGPVVKLKDGNVLRLESKKNIKNIIQEIEEILYLGDILFSYGDFFNRAHSLVPAGYCEEWWILELEKAVVDTFGNLDLDKAAELTGITKDSFETLINNTLNNKITGEAAITLSLKLNIPLYPRYTYYWKLISNEQLRLLINWLKEMKITKEEGNITKLIFPNKFQEKRILEILGVPHILVNKEYIVIWKDDAACFSYSLDLINKTQADISSIFNENSNKDSLEIINLISSLKIRDKAGTFIGARMGRPEKAKMRKLNGSPHVLFPVGDEGGKLRSFQSTIELGKIKSDFPIYQCTKCNKETIYPICETCNRKTKRMYFCNVCGLIEAEQCKKHGKASIFRNKELDIGKHFESIIKRLGLSSYPDLIKGVKGTSNKEHIPEHLAKGILRAKHKIHVNKDGTTRYDMSQLAITHFKPKEANTTIQKLLELGYKTDINNRPLEDPNQILELKPQDVILPACEESAEEGSNKILFRTAAFIDELLVRFYNQEPFYNLKSEQDLIGNLIVALAPHTSAAILCRIIGFSKTQGFYAHPMLHAATRRDCDGDEASVILLMDALLNFSRKYLPNTRGATQDAALVLTSKLIPSEVDDMVFDMDVCWSYPLEFYNSCLEYKKPWDIDVDQIGKRLNTKKQYEGMGFTHSTDDFNNGIKCSAYKLLPSMEEKLKGQMALAEKIRAVDASDVARLVIEKHFLRDIRGNLRKFSQQQFRCVDCNEKYRRPPLIGKCTACGGKIIFTISEGSIIKYLEPALSLSDKYQPPEYLQHVLELTKRNIEDTFGKEKEKQEGLGRWF